MLSGVECSGIRSRVALELRCTKGRVALEMKSRSGYPQRN